MKMKKFDMNFILFLLLAFPFNQHHTTKDFTNSHYRSRKSQRDKDKYFKTISSSRKAFDGQPLSSVSNLLILFKFPFQFFG